jgi:hypothetical protein
MSDSPSLLVAIDQLLEAVDAYQAKFFPASEEWQPLEVAYNVAKAVASRDGLSLPSLEAAGFQIWKKTAQPPGGFLMAAAFSHDRHEAWLAKVKALRTAAEALDGAEGRAAANEQARTPAIPSLRLEVRGTAVFLDGKLVPWDLTAQAQEDAIRYVQALIDANGNWISGPDIEAGTRWDRIRQKLPQSIRSLTETDRRKGNRLCSKAWRK